MNHWYNNMDGSQSIIKQMKQNYAHSMILPIKYINIIYYL